MSEANVALAKRWFQEVWNEQRPEAIYDLMHIQARCHTGAGVILGPEAWKRVFWEPLAGAFSDIRIDVEDVLSDKERVAVRWHAAMRHTGPHMGVPESGRKVEFSGITWLAVRDGQIVEGWDGWDATGMLVSIGGAQIHPGVASQREAAQR